MTTAADVQVIHHVTSIAADPQRNIDFYAKILGASPSKNNSKF